MYCVIRSNVVIGLVDEENCCMYIYQTRQQRAEMSLHNEHQI